MTLFPPVVSSSSSYTLYGSKQLPHLDQLIASLIKLCLEDDSFAPQSGNDYTDMAAPLLVYSEKLITFGPWLVEVEYTPVVEVGNNDPIFHIFFD